MKKFNLTEYCFSGNLEKHPEKTALVFHYESGDKRLWSYNELYDRIKYSASLLIDLGLKKGSRVLIRLESDENFASFFLGAVLAGFIPVPLSPLLTDSEISFIRASSEADAAVISPRLSFPESLHLKKLVCDGRYDEISEYDYSFGDTEEEDPAYLVYTSGTAGVPKGVLHSHRSILGRIPMHSDWTGLTENDRLLHAGHLNWTYTMGVGIFDSFANGAESHLFSGKAEPQIWPKLIEKEKITVFAAVPSVYRRMIKYSHLESRDLSSLRYVLTAGESLSPELRQLWLENTGREMYEALGMSEISTYISSGPNTPVRESSAGKVQKGRNVRIIPVESGITELKAGETGFIAVHRSEKGLMLGYWKNPSEEEQSFREDWFVTGDLAYRDENGYIFYQGREDDTMNSFGYRVSPLEIENAVLDLPYVAEVGVREGKRGDVSVIIAYIVLKNHEDASVETSERILIHCRNKLAYYKVPKEIIFKESLPHGRTGKLLRKELK